MSSSFSLSNLTERVNQKASSKILAYFRIAFAGLVLLELAHYTFGRNDVTEFFIRPTFHFTYFGLSWMSETPSLAIQLFLLLAAVGILGIFLGLFYRASAILAFSAFTLFFLSERAFYSNQWYLIALVTFLLIFLPANRMHSLDVLFERVKTTGKIAKGYLWSIMALTGIVYFFSGIAKVNGDWISGKTLSLHLSNYAHKFPEFLHGPFASNPLVSGLSIGIIGFEILIFPLLLWKRTRLPAFCIATAFHLFNMYLFPIGLFPIIMILCTAVFLHQ